MKKELIIVISIIALFVIGSFLAIPKNNITGNAIAPITFPTDCSEANIRALWDSIFVENSAGIDFNVNDSINTPYCDYLLAYKNISNTYYVIYASNLSTQTFIQAKKVIFNSTSTGYNVTRFNLTGPNGVTVAQTAIQEISAREDIENRSAYVANLADANQTFYSVFKLSISPNSWVSTIEASFNRKIFTLDEHEYYLIGDKNFSRNVFGIVYENRSEESFLINQDREVLACTPNWTRQESACYTNETKDVYYFDMLRCNNLTGKPSSYTTFCDKDFDGFIGSSISDISNNLNLTYYIGGKLLNSTLNYSNVSSLQFVEIRNNGQNFISFNHNFSEPLILSNMSIKTNSNSSSFGYIIINGINEEKTVIFNKKNTLSNQVCIKDSSIDSISDISDSCEDNDEYLLDCPGNNSGYNCSISADSFFVSGLEHSAIMELSPLTNCTPSWSCSDWSACVGAVHTKTCSDLNNCNTTSGKPNLTESCVVPTVCISDWSCTPWSPLNCSSNVNQTRICTDKNNCNSLASKPNELNICQIEAGSSLKTILWIGIFVCFISLSVALIYLLFKDKFKSNSTQNSVTKILPPPISPPILGNSMLANQRQGFVGNNSNSEIPDLTKKQ